MRAYLMFQEGAAGKPPLCADPDALMADLELRRILTQMSAGDDTVYDVCKDALLRPLQSVQAAEYRREVLKDALSNPDIVRRLYAICAAVDRVKARFAPTARLAEPFKNALELLKTYLKMLRDLRAAVDNKLPNFKSEGFRKLVELLERELTDDYFNTVSEYLKEISNTDNILVSAKLGSHLHSVDYTLRRKEKGFWMRWLSAASFTADSERNPEEMADISNRQERAVSEASNILKWSALYLESFFNMLRNELAFYVGCLNLSEKIRGLGMPQCFPELLPSDSRERVWHGLYDVSLALTIDGPVVGNDLEVSGKNLYIITGANQGGKSTFLRSMGQAQLMAQSGMFVGAERFAAPIRRGLFTHFKREEDRNMQTGRLEEELSRMSAIVDKIERGSMVMLNESFSSTNEREGSEICRQVTKGLTDNGVEVFSVSHLYLYAASFLGDDTTQFLRAQRREDAARTFKILPGEPLETAYGEDLYRQIFTQAGKPLGDD
jgi:DNA mismatch repair ATPase MutS